MKGQNASREILEGADAVKSVIARASDIQEISDKLRDGVERVYVVGCGSSLAVGEAVAFWLREAGVEAQAVASSEFYHYPRKLDEKTLVILLSQSGETTETILAMRYARDAGAKTVGITNSSDSPLGIEPDFSFILGLDEELAVMATKTVDATLAAGYILAKSLGGKDFSVINSVPDEIDKIMNIEFGPTVEALAKHRSAYVIASGIDYAGAMEAAIKIGEGALVQATPMYTLEVSHGPKAAASNLPAIFIALQPKAEKDYMRVIKEMKENGTFIIALTNPEKEYEADIKIETAINRELTPFVIMKFAQAIALKLGLLKDIDPDSPPSLKKIVKLS